MSKLRSKLLSHRKKRSSWRPSAIPREVMRVYIGLWRHASIGIPASFIRRAVSDAGFVSWSDERVYSIVGDSLLNVVDALGPLYGKAMQIWFSRLGPKGQMIVERLQLDRVYGDWPALSWDQVQSILDRETPFWRDRLKLEQRPLGVASLSQVHGAVDLDGKRWVVKLVKPKSAERLRESIDAIESAISVAEPFALTAVAKRFLKDMSGLCVGLRQEMNLIYERETMARVRDLVEQKRSKAIRVPQTWDDLCSKHVIVMERFDGIKLSDVVTGKVELTANARKTLARKVLGELLVQIFEWGLFHADPHAGNLMLLEDGAVGLYDWGLAGELLEEDRKYIAGILKSIMALDLEKLIDVLQDMGRDIRGIVIDREKIRKELDKLAQLIKVGDAKTTEAKAGDSKNGESKISEPKNTDEKSQPKPSMHQLIDAALEAAERLGITMPSGLLMMAKSLVTIEGLARGIDEDVSFVRVAGPVLFRAAGPELSDIVHLVKQLPRIAGKWLSK